VKGLLVALLASLSCAAHAQVQVLEHAELTTGWSGNFPDNHKGWIPISLPHKWSLPPHEIESRASYRVRFQINHDPSQGPSQSLYFPKTRVRDLTIYLNGQRVWRLADVYAEQVYLDGLLIAIPPILLRQGENTLHMVARGYPHWFAGVSRVFVGDTVALAPRAALRSMLWEKFGYIAAGAFGAIGLLSLGLWYRVERDPVLFWYGLSGLLLLAATTAWYASQWQALAGLRGGLTFLRLHGYLAPFFVLHLRLVGRKDKQLETVLWIALITAFLSSFLTNGTLWTVLALAFAVLPALLAMVLLSSPQARARPAVIVLVAADLAACLLALHDSALRVGLVDFDRLALAIFAAPFVILAAAAPIFERTRAAVRARERNRRELERRVAEKSREIEASHERLRQVLREQTLAEERRRIMADMHDGLGARLISLLSVAQSGRANQGEISDGIAAALDELRLTVDSALPVEGDVSVVLGRVRHRMRSVFERAGVQLNWNVAELPRVDDLTPERVLAIQRIFLETFSNAIRHSGARTVSVFTLRVPGAVRIVIEDDGRGFDPAGESAGRGLANLQLRASQAGGTLAVESQAGKGTRVTLSLPFARKEPPEPLPTSGEKTDVYPVRGISADATAA
jgi:hypothetical protein